MLCHGRGRLQVHLRLLLQRDQHCQSSGASPEGMPAPGVYAGDSPGGHGGHRPRRCCAPSSLEGLHDGARQKRVCQVRKGTDDGQMGYGAFH